MLAAHDTLGVVLSIAVMEWLCYTMTRHLVHAAPARLGHLCLCVLHTVSSWLLVSGGVLLHGLAPVEQAALPGGCVLTTVLVKGYNSLGLAASMEMGIELSLRLACTLPHMAPRCCCCGHAAASSGTTA
jgi:hypothetical protein